MLHTEIKIKSAKWPAKFAAALEKGVFHVKHVSTLLSRRKNEKKCFVRTISRRSYIENTTTKKW